MTSYFLKRNEALLERHYVYPFMYCLCFLILKGQTWDRECNYKQKQEQKKTVWTAKLKIFTLWLFTGSLPIYWLCYWDILKRFQSIVAQNKKEVFFLFCF